MLAAYDLETQPTTFDFVNWLVNAMTHGATEVSFLNYERIQTKKYPAEVARERFRNILLPVCRLAGVPVSQGDGERFSYFWKDCPQDPCKFKYQKRYDHVTVTIRNYERNQSRNSNLTAWMLFAEENNAVVIYDYGTKPIPLLERWELYQCRMNYFVDNGPAVLCYYSDAPYLSFGWKMTPHLEKQGFHEGYQFPWANHDQRLIWLDDNYENITNCAGSLGHEVRQTRDAGMLAKLAGFGCSG